LPAERWFPFFRNTGESHKDNEMKNILCAAVLLIAMSPALSGQNNITGTVTDAQTGEPLPGAIVSIPGTYYGVATDLQGMFTIPEVNGSNACVVIRYTSYLTDTACINLPQTEPLKVALVYNPVLLSEAIIHATRAGENSAMAYTTISNEEIAAQNFGQDLPYLLDQQPSVVTTSDAGAGFGYTGIRIRGSDGTRVNTTINGIPVNDAESQGTYWVDIPDIASSTEDIQVQRGVGTSSNGAGAFGGSVNLRTDDLRRNPYGQVLLSGGSFNTCRTTAKIGTGLMRDHWAFDARLSYIHSDGYIDRASSDLKSWYFSGGYYGKKITVKAITFSGHEKTYQAWYGVPQDSLKTNRTYNPAGEYYDANGNRKYYDNETDNYGQDYYQLHFLYDVNPRFNINLALHATRGKGYYEQFRQGELLWNYNIGTADTVPTYSDIVRRLWLDNWFYGVTYSVNYTTLKKFDMTIGGGVNKYAGDHYDEVVWGSNLPTGTSPVHRYNKNSANKVDQNMFVKVNYKVAEKLNLYVDVQERGILYTFEGPDTNGTILPREAMYIFFNPKAGVTYRMNEKNTLYVSFGVGNKEPNRDDFVNSTEASRPEHETLYDTELGWNYKGEKLAAGVNIYNMSYKNQLVLTGKINDVGAYTRENAAESYRRGIEISGGFRLMENLAFTANATLSQNKIRNFHEYTDDYDTYTQIDTVYALPDIAFSPNVTGAAQLVWESGMRRLDSRNKWRIALQGKFVGKQYLDNTSNDSRSIDPYFTGNLNISYTLKPNGKRIVKTFESVRFAVQVNNLFNTMYSSNGYTYGYIYGGTNYRYNYYYPQAGINAMGMITLAF
jgi:iron complex outermembrane recepter protein